MRRTGVIPGDLALLSRYHKVVGQILRLGFLEDLVDWMSISSIHVYLILWSQDEAVSCLMLQLS
jgi:hypothetical protein